MTVAHPLQMHWALSVCVLLVHTVKYYSPAKGNFGVCTKTLLPPSLPPKQTATIVNIWASLARSFLTIKIDGNWWTWMTVDDRRWPLMNVLKIWWNLLELAESCWNLEKFLSLTWSWSQICSDYSGTQSTKFTKSSQDSCSRLWSKV